MYFCDAINRSWDISYCLSCRFAAHIHALFFVKFWISLFFHSYCNYNAKIWIIIEKSKKKRFFLWTASPSYIFRYGNMKRNDS